ncbi:MAG: terminase large subunit [Oscillospiraceae bacterium]|nr:terminase large subunit [Oscillospiraceae bacterium]
MAMDKQHPAYKYAADAAARRVPAPRYVKIQARVFRDIANGKNKKYMVDPDRCELVGEILKLINMPKGLSLGQPLYDCLSGFQWLFIIAVLCVVHRDNREKRRYTTAVLEIARKNGKTMLVAVLFLILMLLEPEFSRFYSVAPDGQLSREIQTSLREFIAKSPALTDKFKLRRDDILCHLTSSQFFPLNYSNSRLDGKLPNVFVADEVGALPNNYAVEAMRGGQVTILNKLGCIISTKYPRIDNPFEDEVDMAKKVLDGTVEDETLFALLFEPDDTKKWMTSDRILHHANPLALDVPEVMEDLLKKRRDAIFQPNKREYFITKHCNIIYQGMGTETYISPSDVMKCRAEKPIDWTGRRVWIAADLSMTTDNCAVAMVAEENGAVFARVLGFIPEGRIEEKSEEERVGYREFCEMLYCISCGDSTVDYGVIEDYVLGIEDEYGVEVVSIGVDRYNAMSSAQKWEREGYDTVIIRQHSDTLHPPTKLLRELILEGRFTYDENQLLEINFQNAKCTYDTNMNQYVSKKRSRGKVDMVVALINAVYLLQQDVMFGEADDWAVQT